MIGNLVCPHCVANVSRHSKEDIEPRMLGIFQAYKCPKCKLVFYIYVDDNYNPIR